MVLQKAMKQGRNVHGIPSHEACSDALTLQRCMPHWGAYYFVFVFSMSSYTPPPNCWPVNVVCGAECWLGLTK